ncbi:hypothetical protein [Streptomyces sp. NPDC057686]|uniref:hypothetical protein n=1 Tax=Streptomyces sp. NPDC057686 TaxID=3346212 RepID=UPI0036ADC487
MSHAKAHAAGSDGSKIEKIFTNCSHPAVKDAKISTWLKSASEMDLPDRPKIEDEVTSFISEIENVLEKDVCDYNRARISRWASLTVYESHNLCDLAVSDYKRVIESINDYQADVEVKRLAAELKAAADKDRKGGKVSKGAATVRYAAGKLGERLGVLAAERMKNGNLPIPENFGKNFGSSLGVVIANALINWQDPGADAWDWTFGLAKGIPGAGYLADMVTISGKSKGNITDLDRVNIISDAIAAPLTVAALFAGWADWPITVAAVALGAFVWLGGLTSAEVRDLFDNLLYKAKGFWSVISSTNVAHFFGISDYPAPATPETLNFISPILSRDGSFYKTFGNEPKEKFLEDAHRIKHLFPCNEDPLGVYAPIYTPEDQVKVISLLEAGCTLETSQIRGLPGHEEWTDPRHVEYVPSTLTRGPDWYRCGPDSGELYGVHVYENSAPLEPEWRKLLSLLGAKG